MNDGLPYERVKRSLRTLVVVGVVSLTALSGRRAQAQTADELTAGRQLFAEALDDEEHHRFAAALEKFNRVVKIRDTAAIRYRMGLALEGLGKVTGALDAYGQAIRLASPNPKEADLVKASQARIDALEPKVAHLTLKLRAQQPLTELRVDDRAIPADGAADVRVDPGAHVVTATADGAQPFRAEVSLSEGGRAEIPISFEATPPPPPPPAPPPPATTSSLRTVGIVTAATGGALIVTGLIVLGVRSSTISDLERACPNGDCPAAREKELRDTRSSAVTQGPVAGALLGVGAAAVGVGVVLFFVGRHGESKTATRVVPSFFSHGASVALTREF